MTMKGIYVVLALLLGPLILADAYRAASIGINAAVVGLAALIALSAGIRGNVGISPFARREVPNRGNPRGLIQRMERQVSGAAAGSFYFRQQVSDLLATAYAVRSGGLVTPKYDSIMGARERLKAMAGDTNVREVFEDYRQRQLKRPGLLGRRARESDYLSGLESAIRIVREGE